MFAMMIREEKKMKMRLDKEMHLHPHTTFLLLLVGMPALLFAAVYGGCAAVMLPLLWLGGL
ncbi:MAG: hypothetical protein RR415_02590 [Ruthenibacterium sp.]